MAKMGRTNSDAPKLNTLSVRVTDSELQKLKEYMLTDEYAEQAAREKLGMIKENEIIFQEESGS